MTTSPPRDRSLSPVREAPPKRSKIGGGGFKWKEKPARSNDDQPLEGQSERSRRGYRDRSDYETDDRANRTAPRSERRYDDADLSRARRRSPRRDKDSWRGIDERHDRERWRPRRENDSHIRDRDPQRSLREYRDIDDRSSSRQNQARPSQPAGTHDSQRKDERKSKTKDKVERSPALTSGGGGEPIIVVNINDRLGTKAAIPCLASDSIKAFKAVVAAHIGRQPHEILLKRQGERPFKDQLTLQDYGVSNGVQLDLELDTGD